MATNDEELYSQKLRIQNKDLFVDLKQNKNGKYVKISERSKGRRSSILLPSSGISDLVVCLTNILADHIGDTKKEENQPQAKSKSRIRNSDDQKESNFLLSCDIDVRNLSFTTEEEALAALISSVGIVPISCVIARRTDGRSRGNGILHMESPEVAVKVVEQLQGAMLEGRNLQLRVKRAAANLEVVGTSAVLQPLIEIEKQVDPLKVFVTNLSWATDEQSLTTFFTAAGDGSVEITNVQVLRSRDNKRSLGKAVVSFSSGASSLWAIENLNKQVLDEREISVRQYFINSKEETSLSSTPLILPENK